MSNAEQTPGRLLVVFDGRCVLCNRAVRWLLSRDCNDRLYFAASESPRVAALLARLGYASDAAGAASILVVRYVRSPAEQVFVRSEAVAVLLAVLPSPWPAVAALLRAIPHPLRDMGYRLVARWRYRIWGRLDACPLPTAQEQTRFL